MIFCRSSLSGFGKWQRFAIRKAGAITECQRLVFIFSQSGNPGSPRIDAALVPGESSLSDLQMDTFLLCPPLGLSQ